jgi:hypothetical protein
MRLANRRAKVLVYIRFAHLASSQHHELLSSKKAGFQRLQNYVFGQGLYSFVVQTIIYEKRHLFSTHNRGSPIDTRPRLNIFLGVNGGKSSYLERRSIDLIGFH